jgi:hypothetical protein
MYQDLTVNHEIVVVVLGGGPISENPLGRVGWTWM